MLPKVIQQVDLTIGTLSELEDGVLLYEFKSDILIDTPEVDRMIQEHKKISAGTPRLVLIVTNDRMHTTPEARKADRNELRITITRAEALIISNLATRIATNFYYSVQRPPYPVKTFSNIEAGYNWLKSL